MTVEMIGELIRRERRRQGLTIEQISVVSGVGRRAISEIERGKPTAEIGKVLALIGALGLRLDLRAAADEQR